MKEFAKVVVGHLSPAIYEVVCGVGLGYDPVPREYHDAFINSDLAALIADTEALYLDWCHVHDTIAHHSASNMMETRHHGRVPKSGRRDRREERVA